jgi:hypothetical protein
MQMLRDYTQELKGKLAMRQAKRIFNCLVLAKGDPAAAAQIASNRRDWADSTQIHQIFMGAVGGQSTSTDSGLVGVRQNSLLEFIRPLTITGRLQGMKVTAFDAALTAMSGGTAAAWVGEGLPVPLSKPTFARLATPLGRLKLMAMAVEAEELVKISDPDAELTVGHNFVGACVAAADSSFIDPASAAVAKARPASVTYGSPAFASGGSTALLIDVDLGKLIESLLAHGSTLEWASWVIHPVTAAFLARLRNANGDYAYPDVTVLGGTLMGLPVITSASVPHGGSPSIGSICLVDAARIWIAEDPAIEIGISKTASLQMLDNPTNDSVTPTATSMVSMFQTGSIALRGLRTINWQIADAGFAAVLNGFAD